VWEYLSVTSRSCRVCPATSLSSLPRAYLIGRPAVCSGVVLPVCPCVCVIFQSPRARLVADILARMSRGCYKENWSSREFKLYRDSFYSIYYTSCCTSSSYHVCLASEGHYTTVLLLGFPRILESTLIWIFYCIRRQIKKRWLTWQMKIKFGKLSMAHQVHCGNVSRCTCRLLLLALCWLIWHGRVVLFSVCHQVFSCYLCLAHISCFASVSSIATFWLQAITNPQSEEYQEKAWQAVVPIVSQLKRYYEFSVALGLYICCTHSSLLLIFLCIQAAFTPATFKTSVLEVHTCNGA